ncbi:MATE family efflux transporter [Caenimonas sedimenti]|uniref:Multidrug-efflux transporter n=1 Tax=Caenimonas sedimenti TaxID=2596921 RepID=A0A562ZTN4_9BURK|nr:MATE family efflux transporter [Caenimonas sedimenti]TWO71969.1 MATE family efflux transporter [Caenimonas sedimenti]
MASELRTIARHAGTIWIGQIAVMAFGITDTIVAGRYSQEALAALSVGSAVFISIFVATMGVLQVLLPVWAELHGAGRRHELGRSVRQALYLAALATIVGIAGLLFPGFLLDATGVPEELQGEVRRYLAVLALALPPALLFRMYGTLNQSLGKPQLVTWLQTASLTAKIPLTIWFAFGGAGLPAMGVVGCAWASVVVNYVFLGLAIWLLRTDAMYAPYAIWRRMEPPDWPAIAHFARMGIPAGLAIMVEVTSFTLMALFIARQGTLAAAAHQIASNLAAVLYMMPLSTAISTSSRVSYWLGAGDPKRARACIRTGFKLGLSLALGAGLVVWLANDLIARIYSSDAQVAALAAGLLAWLAVYHVGDAIQALCVFVLRCYRVAVAPLVAYCVLLWGVGLAGGFVLAYQGLGPWPAQQSPAAFWIAAAFALGLLAIILPLILWRAVRAYRPA